MLDKRQLLFLKSFLEIFQKQCWDEARNLDISKEELKGIELSNAHVEVKNLEQSSTDCRSLIRQIDRLIKMKTTYYFDEENKFHIANLDKVIQVLGKKKVLNGDVEFIGNSDNISHQQRKYFFGSIVKDIQMEFVRRGNDVTAQTVKEFLQRQFLFREKLCDITGQYVKSFISLSNSDKALSKEEFQQKKELIQQWAAEKLEIDIKDPDANWKMYKEKSNKSETN